MTSLFPPQSYALNVTAETFKQEIAEAMKAYDKHVVCLEKTPDEFHRSLISLLEKAIKAYEGRGPQLRHGIALYPQVTVILDLATELGGPPICSYPLSYLWTILEN